MYGLDAAASITYNTRPQVVLLMHEKGENKLLKGQFLKISGQIQSEVNKRRRGSHVQSEIAVKNRRGHVKMLNKKQEGF